MKSSAEDGGRWRGAHENARNKANIALRDTRKQQLKRESGKGLLVGGVKLPLTLAELGLIDEYEFVVQPRLAGHGPTLFAGLSKRVD
jgi:dihydrofolate reductase